MTVIDMLEVPELGDPQLSPDGAEILYTVSVADWKENKRIRHIHRVRADGSDGRQFTSGANGESSPRWSPDGSRFLFTTKRSGEERNQAYVMPKDGGEALALTHHSTGVSNPQWSGDGNAVLFLAADKESAEEAAKKKAKDDVFALDEEEKQVHLWRQGVEPGQKEEQLTSGDYTVLQYSISQDGRRIALLRAPSPRFGDNDRAEVWVMDVDGKNALRLTDNRVDESFPSLSPDDSQVVFTSGANDKFAPYYANRAFLVPAQGGTPRVAAPNFPYAIDRAVFTADGRSLLLGANLGVRNELFVLELASGTYRQLTKGDHELSGLSYVPKLGRAALVVDQPDNPGEIWMLDVASPAGKPAAATASAAPRQVTHVSERYARDFKLGKVERLEWQGADGVTVDGVLHYPVDYVPGQRYPLVVQTHGGPRSSDRLIFGDWSEYAKVLTGMGYAVLQPNYRGSTGYGDAFLRDMVGGYFKQSHLDVMAGVDKAIAIGLADPERLVKMGWSAGGHMTNKIITFTDRFKAASSGAGAANWLSMFGQSDTRSYREPWFLGTPWSQGARIDLFWEHSPIKDVAKVKTPTIFLVGEADVRVPPPQSYEMHRALKSNGVPTHLYIAPREPHVWDELRHRLFKINVELDWFEKYARGRTYTWAKAPAE